MKLSHGLGLALAGICSVGLLGATSLTTGCGSSSGGSGSSSGGGSSGGDVCANLPATACSTPPTAPTGPTSTKTTPHNYALHHLFLGDTDRNNQPSGTAWQSFGYDLDGKITTATSKDVCTLMPGTMTSVQQDGPGGVDNSFGANLIPTLEDFASSPSATINTSIQQGHFTVMMDVNGFDDTAGNTTTATGLTGVLLAGGAFAADAGTPSWDMNTHWPILPDLISGCTPTGGCPMGTDPVKSASVQFAKAFQQKGTFASAQVGGGSTSDIQLSLTISSQTITINVHSAVVTFEPDSPGSVKNGIIAGVLNTQELVTQIGEIAGSISAGLCGGSALTTIENAIAQDSDIVVSGSTVSNPAGKACNGISIGLGFDATEIAQPTSADILPGAPAKPSPCGGDAGMGGD